MPDLNFTDNTYTAKEQSFAMAEVGDAKQPDVFLPQVKLMRWDNEVNLSVRLVHDELSPVVSLVSNKIQWVGNKIEAHFYEIGEGKEGGGIEFDIHLKEKPPSPRITFTLQTKGLNFFPQLELTQEEIKEGCIRPENIIDSIAVYHKTMVGNYTALGGKNYKAGKVIHIPRPKMVDSNGWEVWGKPFVDEKAGLFFVDMPEDFWAKAVYPVRHAAGLTFGYTAHGASMGVWGANSINAAGPFSPAFNGVATKVTLYCNNWIDTNVSVTMGIYNWADPNLTKLKDTGEVFITTPYGSPAEYSSNLDSPLNVFAANIYNICCNKAKTIATYFDSISGYTLRTKADTYVPGTLGDSYTSPYDIDSNREYNIWVTYELVAGLLIHPGMNGGLMDAIEKNQLKDRTRARNSSLWVPMDWGGLLAPLAAEQAVRNSLGQPGIENFMAIQDENYGIKEFQRDRTHELNQAEIDNQIKIADDEIATRRETLAIQKATDAYTLAVAAYKAKVNALLMGAREYAAQVELEQLDVEKSRAILAMAKEVLHQKQVNASIFLEYIHGLMVEADIAKYKVEVAKANVRAVLADIAAGEADIRLITAQIEQYVAEADKATLQADVAMIYAEILTKKLSAVKLDIGQKEIAAGFGYIQSRFDDAMTKLATQKIEELLQVDYATAALAEAELIFPDEKIAEDLHEKEQLNAQDVFAYTEVATEQNIQKETILKNKLLVAHEAMSDQRLTVATQRDARETWAKLLIDAAERYVYKNMVTLKATQSKETLTISG